jgi:hypothetical protein
MKGINRNNLQRNGYILESYVLQGREPCSLYKSTVPSTTSFHGPHCMSEHEIHCTSEHEIHCTSEHEMIRRGSNFSPTATRVRHNWCTPKIRVSVYQGMQLQIYGYGEVDMYKKSAKGSGMLSLDPAVEKFQPLHQSRLSCPSLLTFPVTIIMPTFLVPIVFAPSPFTVQCFISSYPRPRLRPQLSGEEFPTCSQRLSLLAGLLGSSGCTARQSLAHRASLLWQQSPWNAVAMGPGQTRSLCPR